MCMLLLHNVIRHSNANSGVSAARQYAETKASSNSKVRTGCGNASMKRSSSKLQMIGSWQSGVSPASHLDCSSSTCVSTTTCWDGKMYACCMVRCVLLYSKMYGQRDEVVVADYAYCQ